MPDVTLRSLSKSYPGARGAKHLALHDVGFTVPSGEFAAILGPSGCGKSTTLRIVAGLERTETGSVTIGERDVTAVPSSERGLAMVFQNYALFPHLSVAENIVFGLKVRHLSKEERNSRLRDAARQLQLEPYLTRRPGQLSGGQRQRVALGRAIVSGAELILMDEPLSNLDARLRAEMRTELRDLQQRLGLTVLYVTHDQVEAMTMADRVVVMRDGGVDQIASPDELYARPASAAVARFIGSPPMNLLPAHRDGGDLVLTDGTRVDGAALLARHGSGLPGDLLIGIRPEDVIVGRAGATSDIDPMRSMLALPAVVGRQELLGADRLVSYSVGGSRVQVRVKASEPLPDVDVLEVPLRHVHVFDRTSEQRIDPAVSRALAATA
ncbi:ABC transporter ATP-binding protein [Plantibacter sp. YIM 135249]|uniref:ABC transporter ATP-binding protein n=1 Tax=Plantibacter sp. YIM 135249 TaxID=3423918 RepID=UPI003D359AD8